ncbi:MAG: hypothetical protein V3S16_12200 [Candidatus Desulfatibia sp.]|uniref:hypothetical protein n=1 Tax=Candidatus Desulfatibia sp. TaxID=3101189 RepID=UPI002F321C20
MKILYLVTKPSFRFEGPWELRDRDGVVLMQDAVLAPPAGANDFFVCDADAKTRSIKNDSPRISHSDIIDMAKKFNKVIVL